ncbi:hypothetical protein ACWEQL_23190 [Kitasatospora sp. NPDC004240]
MAGCRWWPAPALWWPAALLALSGAGEVTLRIHQDQHEAVDSEPLADALASGRHRAWTGVTIPGGTTCECQDQRPALTLPRPRG